MNDHGIELSVDRAKFGDAASVHHKNIVDNSKSLTFHKNNIEENSEDIELDEVSKISLKTCLSRNSTR